MKKSELKKIIKEEILKEKQLGKILDKIDISSFDEYFRKNKKHYNPKKIDDIMSALYDWDYENSSKMDFSIQDTDRKTVRDLAVYMHDLVLDDLL